MKVTISLEVEAIHDANHIIALSQFFSDDFDSRGMLHESGKNVPGALMAIFSAIDADNLDLASAKLFWTPQERVFMGRILEKSRIDISVLSIRAIKILKNKLYLNRYLSMSDVSLRQLATDIASGRFSEKNIGVKTGKEIRDWVEQLTGEQVV